MSFFHRRSVSYRYRVGVVGSIMSEGTVASAYSVKEFKTLKGAERQKKIFVQNGHDAIVMYGVLHWYAEPDDADADLRAAFSAGAEIE